MEGFPILTPCLTRLAEVVLNLARDFYPCNKVDQNRVYC